MQCDFIFDEVHPLRESRDEVEVDVMVVGVTDVHIVVLILMQGD